MGRYVVMSKLLFIGALAVTVITMGCYTYHGGQLVEPKYFWTVVTDTGTWDLYAAPQWMVQDEAEKWRPALKRMRVEAFSNFGTKEIWFSDFEALRAEMRNVKSFRNLLRAAERDNDVITEIEAKEFFRKWR